MGRKQYPTLLNTELEKLAYRLVERDRKEKKRVLLIARYSDIAWKIAVTAAILANALVDRQQTENMSKILKITGSITDNLGDVYKLLEYLVRISQ